MPRLLSQNVIKALPGPVSLLSLHLSARSAFLQNMGHNTLWVLLFEKNRNDYRSLHPYLFLHLFPPKETSHLHMILPLLFVQNSTFYRIKRDEQAENVREGDKIGPQPLHGSPAPCGLLKQQISLLHLGCACG